MDVHVRDLRYFVAVAEELSFTRAATERLFISQPALSKQIRQLERAMKVDLFERNCRAVALTAAGKALLPEARRMIEQWAGARRAVADAARERTLVVGFQTRIGRGLIPRVVAELAAKLPEWQLNFRQIPWRDPTTGLADGTADVAVAWLPVPDTGEFGWKVVATEQRWVAVPLGHRLARLKTVPFARLLDQPFIALPLAAGPARDFWLATDQREHPARVVAESDTVDETFEAVASGLGVALLAAGNAEIYRRDDVVCRPVSGLRPSELAVVWRTGDTRPAVRIFADACQRCLCSAGAAEPDEVEPEDLLGAGA